MAWLLEAVYRRLSYSQSSIADFVSSLKISLVFYNMESHLVWGLWSTWLLDSLFTFLALPVWLIVGDWWAKIVGSHPCQGRNLRGFSIECSWSLSRDPVAWALCYWTPFFCRYVAGYIWRALIKGLYPFSWVFSCGASTWKVMQAAFERIKHTKSWFTL